MVMVNGLVAGVVEALSLNCMVNVVAPSVVGVPVIAPLAEFSDRPPGKEPPFVATDQVYGGTPPLPLSVAL